MSNENSSGKISFKETLNLPRTDFPIRANAKIEDPKILERWEKEDLYAKSFNLNKGKEKYILHDGPPYANGHLHLGHAYNKILKDIVTKFNRMLGKHVPVTPGWDCHGLPIEIKVIQENPGISSKEIKIKSREFAAKWINIQREEFRKLGVLMDWGNPFFTMDYSYEASILHALSIFFEKGYIERKNKTVPWCASCQTVLAAAEIEYHERKDPSVYVLFPLDQETSKKLFPKLTKEVNLLIWTTTPWTLPLNRAVLVKPSSEYVVLDINNKLVLVGKDLADSICALLEVEKKIVAEVLGDKLAGSLVQHPFIEELRVPIIADQSVSVEEGTAFVHCAPGCGPEDYEVGIKNKLEIFSPVTPSGHYAYGIKPHNLEGSSVQDGQIWVIKKLAELDRLLYKTNIKHSYPHCWRCRNPLIFRATTQWFLDLSKHDLRNKALSSVDRIQMVPENTSNRLKAAIEGRLEWCISRQRVWGVPIPAVSCVKCDYTYTSKELINNIADAVSKEGIEYWDDVDIKSLLPVNFSCPNCQSYDFEKETDIIDVWIESGVSHYAVLKKNPNLAFPANIYLEGKDQHRAWFQSSLLTSIILNNQAPMKVILTHGFTVDETGKKMSKSIGNIVTPGEMIDKLGTDGLRLWASSINTEGEAIVSDILLKNIQEVNFKIRNTCKFLISNLYDFDIEKNKVAIEKMQPIDRYALEELCKLNNEIMQAYYNYEFTSVYHKLSDYCFVNLSAFYLDIIKDRLYVEKADGNLRRSAQTACYYILDTMIKLMAPIMSFTSEQVSDYYQKNKTSSIHLQEFNNLTNLWNTLYKQANSILETSNESQFFTERDIQWNILKEIRSALLKSIEKQREKDLIKHPLEAQITIYFDSKFENMKYLNKFFKELELSGQNIEDFFKELLIVSQFNISDSKKDLEETIYPGLFAKVERALGDKCPRCWQWGPSKNEYKLCKRCQEIVSNIK